MSKGYKLTEIGFIPDTWDIQPFVDVTQLITCGVAAKPNYVETGGVPFLSSKNVKKNKLIWNGFNRISVETHKELTRINKPKKGDLLYTRVGSFGDAAVIDTDTEFSVFVSLTLIKPLREKISSYFLAYLLNSKPYQDRAKSLTTGLGVQNLNVSEVRKYPIVVPPLDEQNGIAKILTSVDDKIDNVTAQIKNLQELKKGLMQKLFREGTKNEELKSSPVGFIPASWDVVLLDTVSKRGSGHTPNKNYPEYYNGHIKWISLSDSNKLDDRWIDDSKNNLSLKGIKNSSAVLHPIGTVLMSRDAGIGKSAVMKDAMAVSQHFITWTCDDKLNNWYLYYHLQHNKSLFERIAVGSTIKTIGLPFFKKYLIALPSISEQIKISESLYLIDDRIDLLKQKNIAYVMLKDGLMQQLLTGKVRVTTYQQQSAVA